MKSWANGIFRFVMISIPATEEGGAVVEEFLVDGVGVGGAAYYRGGLQQAYAAPMEKAWNASLTTVDELKMKTTEKSIDNLDQNRVIKGSTKEGKDFQIALEALSKDVKIGKG